MVGHLTPIGRSRRRRLLGQIPGQRQKSTKIGGAGGALRMTGVGKEPTQGRRCGTLRGTGVGPSKVSVWVPQRQWCGALRGTGAGTTKEPVWTLRGAGVRPSHGRRCGDLLDTRMALSPHPSQMTVCGGLGVVGANA